MDYKELIKKAIEARALAYVPYSNFRVGAAILTEDNSIYNGCNIENASYGATNCAERTAIFKAVSEGKTKIKAIAVIGRKDEFTYPCGICRQVIAEFADKDTIVILAKNIDEYEVKTLEEILPGAFTQKDLNI
ncbi:cytidine deaminase [Clostridium cochlearium]|uniref:Cytidine deaminase n=1 Tax=Clostridium cochlearium TaxID=1494 RepID=A0A7Y3V6Q6_CLOCO|nr:cytidine deaminase [Clostridium cochlearium]MBE6064609.1 cytidine deaminase [Clostridium cochlearium]MBU5268440.1 cytidine deaminase [Clostridium cochlearium]MDU1441961.1 cytidine deaminase [Clostridium cochlearium]NMA57975.1 cytidine deaminase [Clostridium cochlearium]NOH15717.1 cytidine deaminase [Clostridium cochlearium]